jgi:hypothetical protein
VSDAAKRSGPIFVGGVDEAACLSVREMLAAHPAIGIGLDFAVYAEVAELRRRMRRSIERGFIDLFCDAEGLDVQLLALLDGLANGAVVGPTVCAGAPDDGSRLADLLALIENARAVYVVGDPHRAVARLLAEPPSNEPGAPLPGWPRVEAAVRQVRAALDAGFEVGRRAPERVLVVSAMHLASEPEAQARRLSAFLGRSWDPALLAPLEARRGEVALDLSPGVRFRIAQVFADHGDLRAQGYDLAPSGLPPSVRLWGALASSVGRTALAARRRLRTSRHAGGALSPSKEST